MNFKVNEVFKNQTEEEKIKNFNLKWAKILIILINLD